VVAVEVPGTAEAKRCFEIQPATLTQQAPHLAKKTFIIADVLDDVSGDHDTCCARGVWEREPVGDDDRVGSVVGDGGPHEAELCAERRAMQVRSERVQRPPLAAAEVDDRSTDRGAFEGERQHRCQIRLGAELRVLDGVLVEGLARSTHSARLRDDATLASRVREAADGMLVADGR
jgi:hypothetical protein